MTLSNDANFRMTKCKHVDVQNVNIKQISQNNRKIHKNDFDTGSIDKNAIVQLKMVLSSTKLAKT